MKSKGIRCLIILNDDDETTPSVTACGQSIFDAQAVTTRLTMTTCGLCLNRLEEQAARKAREQEDDEDRDITFWSRVDRDYDEWKEQ